MSYDDSSVGTGRRQYRPSSPSPFHESGNILTFYGGGGRAEIVDEIVRTRRSSASAVHVHGERGSGRTLLSFVLAERLRHACSVIRHEPSALSRAVLLRHLLIELCPTETDLIDAAAVRDGVDATALARATERVVAQLGRAPAGGRPYLLIVDAPGEADAATLALLDELAAVRRSGQPAMHVVLFRTAEPEAVREASVHGAAPGHHWLRRLTLAEVGEYLRHRMLLADFNRRELFTREMSYFVADRSEGVIGTIDNIARNAFTLASLEDDERPSLAHLLAAGLPPRRTAAAAPGFLVRHRAAIVALLGTGVVASGLALMLLVA